MEETPPVKRTAELAQKVEVQAKATVVLAAIDDVTQTFKTDFCIKCSYLLPKTYDIDIGHHDGDDWIVIPKEKIPWHPQWEIFDIEDIKPLVEVFYYQPSTRAVYGDQNWLVTHKETLELQRFPFDSQKLNVWTGVQSPDAICVPATGEIPSPPKKWFQESDDMYYCDTLANWKQFHITMCIDESARGIDYAIYLKRDPSFYLWNIAAPTFVIVLCNSFMAAVEREEVADRLANTITLLLTAVAFKFVVLQYLPTVCYLTWMDIYMLGGFSLLLLGAMETFFISPLFISDGDLAESIDHWFNGCILCFWIVFHIFLSCITLFRLFDLSIEEIDANQIEENVKTFDMPRDDKKGTSFCHTGANKC